MKLNLFVLAFVIYVIATSYSVSYAMVVPVGKTYQELKLIIKTTGGFIEESLIPVSFVSMLGEAQKKLQ